MKFRQIISYQNIWNEIWDVVGIGLDEGAHPKNAGVEGGKLGLVFRLCHFLEFALLVASRHLAPDLRAEVLQKPFLGLRVKKLRMDQTTQNFGCFLSNLESTKTC